MEYGNIDSPVIIDNTWQVVEDSGELSSALTTYTFSNLTGDTDVEYKLIARIVGNGGATANNHIYVRPNNDVTATYGRQDIQCVATSASAVSGAQPGWRICYTYNNGELSLGEMNIYAVSGNERTALTYHVQGITGTTVNKIAQSGYVWNNTADEITSLNVSADIASGLGIGSRLILLKRTKITSGIKAGSIEPQGNISGVWQKIHDYTVSGSSDSSHTISGLTGDTDVIYKLIFRGVNGSTSDISIRLNNDATTYGFQVLAGNNTTVSGARITSTTGMYMGGYTNTNKSLSETLMYVKSGYERVALSKLNYDTTGTTIQDAQLRGAVYDNTADEITSIAIVGGASCLGIGTHIELWRLNL